MVSPRLKHMHGLPELSILDKLSDALSSGSMRIVAWLTKWCHLSCISWSEVQCPSFYLSISRALRELGFSRSFWNSNDQRNATPPTKVLQTWLLEVPFLAGRVSPRVFPPQCVSASGCFSWHRRYWKRPTSILLECSLYRSDDWARGEVRVVYLVTKFFLCYGLPSYLAIGGSVAVQP